MNDTNSYLVEVEEWQTVPEDPIYTYRPPVISSIRKAMRAVFEIWKDKKHNPRIVEALKLRKVLSRENIGPRLLSELYPLINDY